MLVVLPTHPGDRQLAVNLCEHIAHLGGVTNHECLVVSPAGTNMDGIANVLGGVFGKVFIHQYRASMAGWPYGANEIACEAMIHVLTNPNLRFHYLYLEPDCVPTIKWWLDLLNAEYRRSNMPILGVRIDTIEVATNKVVGRHTVGVAVYPKNFPMLCPLVRGIIPATQQYQQQRAMPPPWDAYFGPYASPRTADTDLIQHLKRKRYQDKLGNVTWNCPSLEDAISQVKKETILIHGCKFPEFIHRITGRTPNAPIARKIESSHLEQHRGDAQREVVRQSEEPPRGEGRQQNGDSGSLRNGSEVPVKPTGSEKVRLRQIAQAEAVRKELGIEAERGTPEYKRACYFHFEMHWNKVRQYARKLRVECLRKTKAWVINEIVRAEKEKGKEPWTKEIVAVEHKEIVPHGTISEEPASEEPQPAWGEVKDEPALALSPAVPNAFEPSRTAGNNGGMPVMAVPYGGRATITPEGQGPAPTVDTGGGLSPEREQQMRQMLIKRGLMAG